QKNEHLLLTGNIRADVTQQCVRTLEPVPQHLDIEVNELFFPGKHDRQKEIELNEQERGELLQGDTLDLGEIVVQLLSLNLNPYPVAPESKPVEYHDENGFSSPFEILKKKE